MYPRNHINHPHGINEIFVADNTNRIYCSICNNWIIVSIKKPTEEEEEINRIKEKIQEKAKEKFGWEVAKRKFRGNPWVCDRKRWLWNMVDHYMNNHQKKNLEKNTEKVQIAIRQIIRYNPRTIRENGFTFDDLMIFSNITPQTKNLFFKTLGQKK